MREAREGVVDHGADPDEVTPSAHVLVSQRRPMPGRVWDGVMATQFRRLSCS